MIHVNIMDFIWKNYADNPKVAKQLAGWKDDHINPITDRMRSLLEATKNKVILGTGQRVCRRRIRQEDFGRCRRKP